MFAPELVLPGYAELAVEPLALDEVHSLLQDRLGVVLPRPTLRALHETTGGNPFFALELARAFTERGAAHVPGEAPPLPRTLRELLGARLEALSAETRNALLAAAASTEPTLQLVQAAQGSMLRKRSDLQWRQTSSRSERAGSNLPIRSSPRRPMLRPSRPRGATSMRASRGLRRDLEERARHLALAAEGA